MIINIMGLASSKIKKVAKQAASFSLEFLNQPCVELSIKFVSPKEIQRLNKDFRNIDKVTDVLSFPATDTQVGEIVEQEGTYLGDMAICLKQAKKQAKEYNWKLCQEVQKLVIHSVLHLLGYDHIEDKDYQIMNEQEQKIAEKLKGE